VAFRGRWRGHGAWRWETSAYAPHVPAPYTDQLPLELAAEPTRAPIDLRPMLPRAARELPTDGRYLFDAHWGGPRTLAHVGPEGARLIVGAREVTAAFAEVVAALAGAAPPGTILDGELVVPDASGHLDRPALRRRLRGRTGAAVATATFVVGDLPWLAGVPLLSEPTCQASGAACGGWYGRRLGRGTPRKRTRRPVGLAPSSRCCGPSPSARNPDPA